MAVKPAEGEILEQTTRTRVVKAKPEEEERIRLLPLWEYVETVNMADWANGEYEFTVYRGTKLQKADEKIWVGKFREKITPEVIQSRWGGGEYNVWLKCPPGFQLRYNVDLKIEGEPRTSGQGSYSVGPVAGDANSQIIAMLREELRAMREEMKIARGGDLGIEAVRQALTLNGQVFSSGAASLQSTLQNVAGGGTAHAASPMDELTRTFLQAAISKMLNPADPIENFSKMATAMKAIGFGGDGGGKSSMALELVRQVPTIAQTLVQGLSAWQGAEEARARHAAILRGGAAAPPPINVPANPPPAPPPSNVVQMPDPVQTDAAQQTQIPTSQIPGMQVQPMPLETLEQMICQIVADENLTAEQAANEACSLIERSAPGQTDQMVQQGEEWLFNLFQIRPVLAQVAQHPRLREFIREFIKVVKAAPVIQDPNPRAPVA